MADNGGCSPGGEPKDPLKQPLGTEIYELSKTSPETYRCVAVPLKVTLTQAITSGQDTYQAPSTHHFIIESVVGHLALIDLFDDDGTVDTGAFAVVPTIHDRILVKAMNTRMQLTNSDRGQPIFENNQVALSSILEIAGGKPLEWSRPHVLPNGETLQLDVSLVQATTAGQLAHVVGGDTEYGVMLVGQLIRVRAS